MKKSILAAVLVLFVINSYADPWSGYVNFFLGKKTVESEDWSPVDDHSEFGVLVDFKEGSWPVSVALDTLVSYDETTMSGIQFEGLTSEFNAGVRKIWDISGSTVRPYIGGGLAFIRAEFQTTSFSVTTDSDTSAGVWLNGGVYFTLGQHFNVGLDLRYSEAEVTLFGIDGEAGGTHAGLILGYHW